MPATSPQRRSSRLAAVEKASNGAPSKREYPEGASYQPPKNGAKKMKARIPIKPDVDLDTLADRKLASLRHSKSSEPFPDWVRPTPEESLFVAELLRIAHGYSSIPRIQPPKGEDSYGGCGDVSDVLDALTRTVLSCNTTNKNSRAQHKSLCDTFGKKNWQAILDAPHAQVAEALRCGGLHENKARVVQGILQQTYDRYGKFSLDHLHNADAATVMEELVAFKGVGPKVASCVAMFALGLDEMAVDTHVHRIVIKLGWVPPKASRDQTYHHLAVRVPNDLKYALHILLIKHGKSCACCSARGFPTKPYTKELEDEQEAEFRSSPPRSQAQTSKAIKYPAVACPLKAAKLFARKPLDGKLKKEVGDADDVRVKVENVMQEVHDHAPKVKKEEEMHVEL